MIGTASGHDLAVEYDRVCGGRRPQNPVSNQRFKSMAANEVQVEGIEKNTCGFCLELNIGNNGQPIWDKDMGWDVCSNPYCGGI